MTLVVHSSSIIEKTRIQKESQKHLTVHHYLDLLKVVGKSNSPNGGEKM